MRLPLVELRDLEVGLAIDLVISVSVLFALAGSVVVLVTLAVFDSIAEAEAVDGDIDGEGQHVGRVAGGAVPRSR